jgi:protein-S-isoprenylcysteine O-methyltransferase Ste14
MSFLPVFKIGFWNARILTLYVLIHPLLILLIVKNAKEKMEFPDYIRKENIISIFTNLVLFFGLFIFSIFLPLRMETAWFYTGLTICLLGIVVWTTAMLNIADIPLGEPWTKGLYRYSRHPMTLSSHLVFIGAGSSTIIRFRQ